MRFFIKDYFSKYEKIPLKDLFIFTTEILTEA